MISVIIPTYSRAPELQKLLEDLLQQKKDGLDFEVIVADNNSQDNTKSVVEALVPRFEGRLRYLFQPEQGKTFALNLAIEKAKGDIMAFIDDDCRVEESYLRSVQEAFAVPSERVDFIGGKILPRWINGDMPAWLKDLYPKPAVFDNVREEWFYEFFLGPIGILDWGEKPFVIDYSEPDHDERKFYGANMAFRRSLFETYGGFATDRAVSEDTEICLRLFRAGKRGKYTPTVKVFHNTDAAKVTFDYYYRWYFLRGQYMELETECNKKFYQPLGVPLRFLRQTMHLFVRSAAARSLIDKMYLKCLALFNLGQMLQIAKGNIK